MAKQKNLSQEAKDTLISILKTRFETHRARHENIQWTNVEEKLRSQPEKLCSLYQMEQSGGEPDVVGQTPTTGTYHFFDCSPESPTGRRSLCYDMEALESRKLHKPKDSAVAMAIEMGCKLLTETQYQTLQTLGTFDIKTSSWLCTPPEIRALGGAIFGDRRFGRVFIYHNGAESYYGARGFRCFIEV
ncbi:MAG TPA: DUF4256 domain-containing protein [Aquaticitalea sp.]|nr:DUF4256 domain-containing protein [Aquaticitalea sp.]HNU58451.1 DUF4256 domain-containing protein [Aquaticitalea sp.]